MMIESMDGEEQSQAPRKVIHDPTKLEMAKVNEALERLGFRGSRRGILLMGEGVFEQYWISDTTRNWFGIFKSDMCVWEECSDSIDKSIRQLMVELDYVALMLSLERDAETIKQLEQNAVSRFFNES